MTVPNILTSIRLLLVIPLVVTILQQQFGLALVILLISGVSDLLDGFLARLFNSQTWLGSILDPAADKLTVAGSYLALLAVSALPAWLFWLVLMRDVIVALCFVYLRLKNRIDKMASPPWSGKLAVAFQVGVSLLTVVNAHQHLHLWLTPIFIICAFLTLLSLSHYFWIYLFRERFTSSRPL